MINVLLIGMGMFAKVFFIQGEYTIGNLSPKSSDKNKGVLALVLFDIRSRLGIIDKIRIGKHNSTVFYCSRHW